MIITDHIQSLIQGFIADYAGNDAIKTQWGTPLVAYADAHHPIIQSLPKLIRPSHQLPQDILPDASVILCYYVPFTPELAKTNRNGTDLASAQWARAYEETNAMFPKLNAAIIDTLALWGYTAVVAPGASTFDAKDLVSDWSHRHMAYAAGMGTFGINNMLITEAGCCGRFFTLVTNLDITPGAPMETEMCLFKANGTCGVCMKNCPSVALIPEGYDRTRCYAVLMKNAAVHTSYGTSYMDASGRPSGSAGSDVCGKCITASPCAFWKKNTH